MRLLNAFCVFLLLITSQPDLYSQNKKADGYMGIWFTLGQFSEYGDKYSGGLGTYTADHIPIAIYAPEVKKTFFVYGGTTKPGDRHLLIMVSYYDHQKKVVPKPVIVYDKEGVNDPHDNAAISIDSKGFIWVFVSGRAKARPGLIFRSTKPYSIESFEKILEGEMTYPQPWYTGKEGFLYLLTKYTKGRELYWTTSPDGITWAPHQKLAGMGGHYQVTNMTGKKLVSVFNYHPGGNVDKRTNIYAVQTEDNGKTWKTIDGKIINPPLTDIHNDALVYDYEAEKKLVYINDLNFDKSGNPVILAIISRDFKPGPGGSPREWFVIHWKNNKWNFSRVCESDHNYDMGSLYTEEDKWRIIGPTTGSPQAWGAGGEMALWESNDEGITWKQVRQITTTGSRNHSYARRILNQDDEFYAFWADGNPDSFSESHLYFCDRSGMNVMELPYSMKNEFEKPVILSSNQGTFFDNLKNEAAQEDPKYTAEINSKRVKLVSYKDCSYISVNTTSAFTLKFTSKEQIAGIYVSPMRLNIKTAITGSTAEITLPGPGYYAIKINGKDKIFVFADLPEDKTVAEGISVLDFGVDNTGKSLVTLKLQEALRSAALNKQTLVFPAGLYLTGSVEIPSGTRIYLQAGAVIKAADDIKYLTFNDSIKPRSFFRIKDAKNVSIRGRGVIDGNGRVLRDKFGDDARMRLLLILNSSSVNIDGIFLRDPGSWNTHILYSDDVDIRNIKMINDTELSNTDGFDPDASKNVTIAHCFARCSDDNVAVKTTGTSGYLREAENIIVRGCLFMTKKSALKVGTESLAKGIKNITFVDNDVAECDRGMALYCADGAVFDNIRFINNRFETNYPDAKRSWMNFTITRRKPDSRAGEMKNILVKDCSFLTEFPRLSEISGIDPEHRISLVIENLRIGGRKITGFTDGFIKPNDFTDITFR